MSDMFHMWRNYNQLRNVIPSVVLGSTTELEFNQIYNFETRAKIHNSVFTNMSRVCDVTHTAAQGDEWTFTFKQTNA